MELWLALVLERFLGKLTVVSFFNGQEVNTSWIKKDRGWGGVGGGGSIGITGRFWSIDKDR